MKLLIKAHNSIKIPNYLRYQKISDTHFIVYLDEINTSIIDFLQNDKIQKIEIIKNFSPLNRWSAGYLQDGNSNSIYYNDYMMNYRKLQKNNLTGQNQVITLVDTGIDMESPYFKDENNDPPFNTTNFNHRKVIRYEILADNKDRNGGHGTHVAGIISGDAESLPYSLYNGIAPKSKLYFIDIGKKQFLDDADVDYDINDVVKRMKELNSHIFSYSWGFPIDFSDIRSTYDYIAEKNPEILFVFAGGNSGNKFSIYQPSGSKNVVSVAGCSHPSSGNIENLMMRDIYILKNDKKRVNVTQTYWSPDFYSKFRFNNQSFFRNQSFSTKMNPKTFFFMEYDNTTCQKIKNFNENQSLAIFIKSDKKIECPSSKIPIFLTKEKLKGNFNCSIIYEPKTSEISYSEFSSKGPNDVGILKPDLVAPSSYIISAKANSKEIVGARTGTSMAAPFIAGSAALIRQYLEEGYYLKTKSQTGIKIKPTACLLKCFLIHSCIPIVEHEKTPDFSIGFGVPKLDDLLFINETHGGYRFIDNITIDANSHYISSIKIISPKKRNIKATLVYNDPALDEESQIPLAADLDLVLESPSKKFYFGNGKEETHSTVESITIPANETEEGFYKIHIFSNNMLFVNSVRAAIIFSGEFNHFNDEKFLVFTKFPSQNRCKYPSTGVLCQINSTVIRSNQNVSLNVSASNWKYLSLKLPKFNNSIILNIEKSEESDQVLALELSFKKPFKYGGQRLNYFHVTNQTTEINVKRSSLKNFSIDNPLFIGFYLIGYGNCQINASIQVLGIEKELIHPSYIIVPIIIIIVLVFIIRTRSMNISVEQKNDLEPLITADTMSEEIST
ncbi:Clan SB, family S8, subtilisin-like serine peptidase [Trichomonas vaginalis G3]|uniref:Clan SB, family S8, subtilisin-like serine peptidase n=1 Tax=Trichomonas vaginalis (strain ATCC PRA-98 / G3) TaxID=412133 RepID=A2EAC5_TRIV3|nr:proprotein convertase-related family [Trichomonas vaginalis G3]EAY10352.1 Clan SB, family S8, subtilisin-like serine peptidase [Trichomonas vaginalis G3]KAI5485365.1 proprotein convertase-related family [Trichomonas vaginalis G3]|eukprot:XP_001322575.1 Clan SB, family S8, subtilisin-like serine peptidase [Trichomonas vaginalis G3]